MHKLELPGGEVLEGLASLTDEDLAVADCVLVHTAHSCYDLARVARTATLVYDTRGVVPRDTSTDSAVLYRL